MNQNAAAPHWKLVSFKANKNPSPLRERDFGMGTKQLQIMDVSGVFTQTD